MTPPPGTSFDGLHVLLAEDNRTNRMLIQAFLRGLPLHLSFACDGHEAVAHTLDLRPDIVLMDVSMPGLDGLAATAEIRRIARSQPRIIALTANTTPSHEAVCLAAGMDAFLPKPVHRDRLLHLLKAQATHQSRA